MTIDAVSELSGAIVPVVALDVAEHAEPLADFPFDQIAEAARAAVALMRPEATKTDVSA